MVTDFDVVIVGAGISGINAAQRVQTLLPHLTYTILEARDDLGGTWDLFKYPGIRSDSDLYTFGFPWRLWESRQAIADGPSIKKYLSESALSANLTSHIQYNHTLKTASWSTKTQRWRLSISANNTTRVLHTKFIIYGSGYYDYHAPLQTTIPNLSTFTGQTIHPQFWPSELSLENKQVVIIGSGATAVTLLPVLAQTAKKVTMLQRSPTYILSAPSHDDGSFIRAVFPNWLVHNVIRWKFMWGMWLYFQFCRIFPTKAKSLLKTATEKELPSHIPYEPHFKPSYNPWQQRLCVCPNGDFYAALRSGKADVVTDTIDAVTENGIRTSSGKFLEADIIVTATGLKMLFAGGTKIDVDGTPIPVSSKYLWKGTFLQDVPNTAFLLGYTNASWTLGAEASMQLFARVLRMMREKGRNVVVPKVEDGVGGRDEGMREKSMMNLKSTYILRGREQTPKAGDRRPWLARTNYFRDWWDARFGGVEGLVFE